MTWQQRLLEHELRDRRDADGRCLGEVSSLHYTAGVVREVACPYSGQRAGKVMNAAALQQVGSVWPEVLARLSQAGGEGATLGELWRGLVGVLVDAATSEEPVPRPLSATYKVSVGFLQVFTSLLLAHDGLADAFGDELGDAEALYPLLEPSLVGAVQVCAGSPRQVKSALGALRSGTRAAPSPHHAHGVLLVVSVLMMGVKTRAELLAGRGPEGDRLPLGLRWLDAHPGPWFRPVLVGPCAPLERVMSLGLPRHRGALEALARALDGVGHHEREVRYRAWLEEQGAQWESALVEASSTRDGAGDSSERPR